MDFEVSASLEILEVLWQFSWLNEVKSIISVIILYSRTSIMRQSLLTAVALKKLKLVKILLEGGAKVNQKGYDGKTALTVACSVLIEEFDHPNSLFFVIRLNKCSVHVGNVWKSIGTGH
jgi:hypothetical protein